MEKLLLFPGRSEKGIFNFVIDAEKPYLEKTAAEYHPTIAAYIHNAKPMPGKTQILLTALGAGEYWGKNANSDFFPEAALAHEGDDYGYKTFVTHAKVYKHHVNKDPKASYGDVALAVYNPVFHRVELIVIVDNKKAPDIVEKVANGEDVWWSMGCLRATAPVLMSDYSTKAISEIKPGDKVINAVGGVSKVSYAHSHKHVGSWYHIQAIGVKDIEPTTEEHPWLVIERKEVRCKGNPLKKQKIHVCLPNRGEKKTCEGCPRATLHYNKQWKRADELNIGDFIATPILQGEGEAPEDRFAYLLGVYLAEGHTSHEGYIHLSVNAEEGKIIFDKLKASYPALSIIWAHDEALNAATISIYDKDLGTQVLKHAKKLAHFKKLSDEVMLWPAESQKIMLGGYCDGDGGVYKDAVYFSTCNKELAEQVRMILLRCGCISSLNINLHKPSTIVKRDTVEFQTWVGRDTAIKLKGYSFKTADLAGPKVITRNLRFIYDGHLWSPIVAIDVEVCDEEVFNIGIESGDYDKDSYVVNGVALHNCKVPYDVCSICGNKAPTRKQYCEHLRYYMGRIHPETGKQVYAINTMPRFFDISQVFIPADKTAGTLLKVASTSMQTLGSAYLAEKLSAVKSGAIEKETPADEPPASQTALKENADALLKMIPEVKAHEAPLPENVVTSLGEAPLDKALSTMTMLGIVPKPQEFQRIYLISIGKRDIADQLAQRNICFDPMMAGEPSRKDYDTIGVNYRNFDADIMRMLLPFMAERSYAGPHLGRRVAILVKHAEEMRPHPVPNYVGAEKAHRKLPLWAMMAAAAGAYAALARSAPKESLRGIDKLLSSNAGLGVATALGISLISAFGNSAGAKAKGNFTQGSYENPDASDVFSRIEALKQKPTLKVASNLGAASKRLFLGVPAAYMASGILQKHREINPYGEEGRIKSFVRHHPDVVSGALIADAMLSAKGHPLSSAAIFGKGKSVAKAVGRVATKLAAEDELLGLDSIKTADDAQEYLSNALVWPLAMGKANLPGRIVGGLLDQGVVMLSRKHMAQQKARSSNQQFADAGQTFAKAAADAKLG